MAREAKVCRGSWCLGFGFAQPATLEQVVKVLSAFGYDGIELAGFFDHATIDRYPDKESRKKLVEWIHSFDLEIVGYAPGPYGDFGTFPWASGDDDAYKGYLDLFERDRRRVEDEAVDAGTSRRVRHPRLREADGAVRELEPPIHRPAGRVSRDVEADLDSAGRGFEPRPATFDRCEGMRPVR